MRNKIINICFLIFTFAIFAVPKINIINIPGNSTGIRIDDFITLFMLVYIIIKNYKSSKMFKLPNRLSKISILFIVYIVLCLLAVFFGYINGYISLLLGVLYVFRKIEYFVYIYIGYDYYKTFKGIKNLEKVFDLLVVFHFIVSLVQKLGYIGSFNAGHYIPFMTQDRVSSTFNGAYELSAFLLLLLPFILYRLFNKKYDFKRMPEIILFTKDIILAFMILYCIVISNSRSSLVIFLIVILISTSKKIRQYLKNRREKISLKSKMLFLLAVTIIIAIPTVVTLNSPKVLARFKDLSMDGFVESTTCAWKYKNFDNYIETGEWYYTNECLSAGKDGSYNMRINHWMQLFDGYLRHPLIGLGASVTTVAADGDYVRILVESGMLGFILWIIIMCYIFRSLSRRNDMNDITKMVFLTISLGALFIDLFEASKIMMLFWLIYGITLAMPRKKNDIKNVIIVNDFNYIQGGASKVAIETADSLKNDYNVTFFCGDIREKDKIQGIKYVATYQTEALKYKNKIRGIINGLYNFKASHLMKKILKKYDQEETLIHVHGWTKVLSSSIFNYAFDNDYNVTITLHDYFTVCPNGGFFNYKTNEICKLKPCSLKCINKDCDSRNSLFKIYRLLRIFIQNIIVGLKYDLKYAIGISDLSIKVLEKHFSNDINISKIKNPIDLNMQEKVDIKNNKYYLYVGRITKEKGVENICKIARKLKYKLLIIGDGSELNNYRKEYPNVEFLGWKNNDEVNKYMKGARILLFPSLWYEGAPLTPLEAMNFGVPSLISKYTSAVEYVDDNGCVFDPKKEESILKGIKEIEDNIELYSANAYRYVNCLKKVNYKSELIEYYNEIISK